MRTPEAETRLSVIDDASAHRPVDANALSGYVTVFKRGGYGPWSLVARVARRSR